MFFKNLLCGIVIGIGFIIPGVSGGVLAAIMGIYDKIIFSINNLFKNFKKNITYLLPIIIGSLLGIFGFSKIILFCLNNHKDFVSYVFIGLILGSVPFLLKEIKNKTDKRIAKVSFISALLLGIFLYFLENYFNIEYNTSNFLVMIIAGFFYAIGKIVPGISGSALLMVIGVYEYLLRIIANPFNVTSNILISLIPFIISFIISAIIILKLINYLIINQFRHSYSAIIGFILSSILFLIPDSFNIFSIFIIIFSFLISYNLSN